MSPLKTTYHSQKRSNTCNTSGVTNVDDDVEDNVEEANAGRSMRPPLLKWDFPVTDKSKLFAQLLQTSYQKSYVNPVFFFLSCLILKKKCTRYFLVIPPPPPFPNSFDFISLQVWDDVHHYIFRIPFSSQHTTFLNFWAYVSDNLASI